MCREWRETGPSENTFDRDIKRRLKKEWRERKRGCGETEKDRRSRRLLGGGGLSATPLRLSSLWSFSFLPRPSCSSLGPDKDDGG